MLGKSFPPLNIVSISDENTLEKYKFGIVPYNI
jgi:hypothetical protein